MPTTVTNETVAPSGQADRIDNTLLREAFEDSGLTATLIAHRIGWTYTDKRGYKFGDSSRVKRALGVMPARDGRSGDRGRLQKTISSDVAALIADAISADPIDVGL